jgi:hypothetical protein
MPASQAVSGSQRTNSKGPRLGKPGAFVCLDVCSWVATGTLAGRWMGRAFSPWLSWDADPGRRASLRSCFGLGWDDGAPLALGVGSPMRLSKGEIPGLKSERGGPGAPLGLGCAMRGSGE